MATDDLFFSVIVRTYKRPCMLKKCLDHLRQQSFDHNRYEIIVVDDGSGMFTKNLLGTYAAADPQLTAIFQPHSGLSSAQKTGAEKSRGDILVFIDDDCFAPPHWLATYEKTYATIPGLDGVAGGIRLSETFNLAGYKYYEGHTAYFDNLNRDLGMDSRTAGKVWFSFGANRSIRRDTWFKVQPEPGLWHFDDYAMDCTLRDIGAFIFYEPEAWVRHNYNLNLYERVRIAYRLGKAVKKTERRPDQDTKRTISLREKWVNLTRNYSQFSVYERLWFAATQPVVWLARHAGTLLARP